MSSVPPPIGTCEVPRGPGARGPAPPPQSRSAPMRSLYRSVHARESSACAVRHSSPSTSPATSANDRPTSIHCDASASPSSSARRQVGPHDRHEPGIPGRGRHDRLQVDEPVRDVDRDDAAGIDRRHRGLQRLDRQQVHRHRIRREGVEHEQVERAGRDPLERQPAVPDDDLDRRRRVGQEREARRVPGDGDDRGIDLGDPQRIARPAVGGHGARPEPDGPHPQSRQVGLERLDDLAERPGPVVVGQRLARERPVERLAPVDRRARRQDVQPRLLLDDPVEAVERAVGADRVGVAARA